MMDLTISLIIIIILYGRCIAGQHPKMRWARSVKSGRAPVGTAIRSSRKNTGKGTRRKGKGRLSEDDEENYGN